MTDTQRAERFAVLVQMSTGVEEIAPVPGYERPVTYFDREDAVWALGKLGAGRLVRFVEVREDEEVMPIAVRHLAGKVAYGDAWPQTAAREADERALFRAWDAACVATHLERIDPPYETLRAFLAALGTEVLL